MRVLVVGSGGREHALVWKIHQSPLCDAVYAAPGGPGMAREATLLPMFLRTQVDLGLDRRVPLA